MAVPEIPTLLSLGVIVGTLVITTAASLYKTRVKDGKTPLGSGGATIDAGSTLSVKR